MVLYNTNDDGVKSEAAVEVRQACKSYGSKKDLTVVLDQLDMTIPRGCIYALLGASGSGKTTLVTCLVGTNKLDSGEILVLGTVPGKNGAASPGPRVGYMPQENSLYQELTVLETMRYFGWIAGIATRKISKRLEMLAEMLLINDVNQQVGTLSGGEQRRISFAVVLLYRPEVLVLDEPTVGLDPVLRQTVWKYLQNLVDNGSSTILLTTHYIEEARQANTVGLIRKGYLIAEAPPQSLLDKFNVDTLEEVFLSLSTLQDTAAHRVSHCLKSAKPQVVVISRKPKIPDSPSWRKVNVLVWKQFLTLFRNLILLVFVVLATSLSVVTFFFAFGHDPKSITVAVINYNINSTCTTIACDSLSLACNYIELLKGKFDNLIYLPSEDTGVGLLNEGKIHAYVVIKPNYSSSLKEQIVNFNSKKNWHYEHSSIEVYRDYLSKNIAGYIKKSMVDVFDRFIETYLISCNMPANLLKVPIQWKGPVYGKHDLEITMNRLPPFMLLCCFFVASMVTSTSILMEKNSGTYERILSMGVGHIEILISHIISDFCLVLCQCIVVLVVAFEALGLSSEGSNVAMVSLVLLNSVCGMFFGYATASILKLEGSIMQFLSGCMTPAILLSGTLWPREGMHAVLKEASSYLPLTQAAQSYVNVVGRGWGMSKSDVYVGFINCFAWIIICLITCIVCLRCKKN